MTIEMIIGFIIGFALGVAWIYMTKVDHPY